MTYEAGMRELFWLWPSGVSSDDVDRILSLGARQSSEPGTLFSTADELQGLRSCGVRWLRDEWLIELLWPFIEEANTRGFGVDVERRAEFQIVEYQATNRDHYGWHHDVHWNGQDSRDRKISITVQLSDSNAYSGGDFEFEEVNTNADFRAIGTVVAFPSYVRHRVQPVSAGTRLALVAWFHGPRWR